MKARNEHVENFYCVVRYYYGYTGNFSPAIALQFSELTALPSCGKKWQPGTLEKFANRKIARIFRVFNFNAISKKMLDCQRKTCYTQNFAYATAMR